MEPLPRQERAARPRRRVERALLALAAAQVLVWWSLPLLRPWLKAGSEASAATEPVVLFALALKLAVLVLLAIDLAATSRAIGADRVRWTRALVGWTCAWLFVALPLALFRDGVASWVDSATSHLYSHRFVGYVGPFGGIDDRPAHQAWIEAWESGSIVARELPLFPLLAAVQVGLARLLGAHVLRCLLAQAVATLALTAAWVGGFGLLESTYDLYHVGVLAGPVLVDLAGPVVVHQTETPIAALLWLALALANRWIRRAVRASA